MKKLLICYSIIFSSFGFSQSYNYYFVGDTTDVEPQTSFGVCMMGGASEDDNGSTWFLNRSGGGNVVVIRASGSDGYNEYFFNDLGVTLQSVETIVFNDASAAEDPFVVRRLEAAEAIWIAGGDQYIYEQYWKNSSVMNILNDHVNIKQAPIGGTSAGMAILGGFYFNAAVSSVTSNTALSNPFDAGVTIESDFISIPFLERTITDTHYDNPDRKGRHSVFIARIMQMVQERTFGIAAEEYVAICIDENGLATVFGEYPDYDDKAYFIQSNCRNELPEIMEENNPITWVTNEEDALIVYEIEAKNDGTSTFDLSNWGVGQNGVWKYWTINNGDLIETSGAAPDCLLKQDNISMKTYPNPTSEIVYFDTEKEIDFITVYNSQGKNVLHKNNVKNINVAHLDVGIYYVKIQLDGNVIHTKFTVKH